LPSDGCVCRKPKPFLIRKAAEEFDLDLPRSYFIGDHAKDMEAGRSAGTAAVFIGPEAEAADAGADLCAKDLPAAAEKIIARRNRPDGKDL